MIKKDKKDKQHLCPFGIGNGSLCIFHDHDDEVCCECIESMLYFLEKSLVELRFSSDD